MNISLSLVGAFLMDTLIGDPQYSFHPVRIIGNTADRIESFLTRKNRTRLQGFYASFLVIFINALPICLLIGFLKLLNPLAYNIVSGFVIYISFALRDLNIHGSRVYKAIKQNNVKEAGKRLSCMVSRNTEEMDEREIIKTTLESLAENLSDSVIAPLFYTALFGAGGAWVYRIINTLDAMWGYKTEKYKDFGFIAAKADDILNFIPARLSAALISLVSLLPGYSFTGALQTIKKDAAKHHSPNSGYPEAAAAGAIGVGFGGPANYFGTVRNNPTIGYGEAELNDIPKMIRLNTISTITLIAVIYLIQGVILQ